MSDSTAMRSAAVLRTVVGGLQTLAVDTELLLRRAGVDRAELDDDGTWLPVELQNRVWEEAWRMTGDDLIGMRVAGLVSLDVHQVLGGVARHSATLGDAVIRLSRFGALLGPDFEVSLEVRGESAVVRAPRFPGTQLHLQGTLCQLATYALLGRQLTGLRITPLEIRCIHERPSFAPALDGIFQTKVNWESSHNALVIESRHLHAPVLGHDPDRIESLEARAQVLLGEMSQEPSLARAAEGLLSLGIGSASLRQLATVLNLNERTLTRRLAADGTTYAKLRDRVRLRRAREYLESTRLSTCEIGLMLGFSDGTAFARAFKRWTGRSPRTYRQDQTLRKTNPAA